MLVGRYLTPWSWSDNFEDKTQHGPYEMDGGTESIFMGFLTWTQARCCLLPGPGKLRSRHVCLMALGFGSGAW